MSATRLKQPKQQEQKKQNKQNKQPETVIEWAIASNEKRLQGVVRSHNALIKITLMSVLITLLLAVSLGITVIKLAPHNQYFATTSDGRLVKLTPLDEALLSLPAVEEFAGRAISNTFTFDYANYARQISANSDSYTTQAFDQIKSTLEGGQGIVTQAIAHNWVVTTTVMAAPTLAHQGQLPSGHYGWRLIFLVRITFQSESQVHASRYTASVIVTRVNQTDNPKGVAISQLTLTPYRGSDE